MLLFQGTMKTTLEDRGHHEKDGATVKTVIVVKGSQAESSRLITHISKHGKFCLMGCKSQMMNWPFHTIFCENDMHKQPDN